MRLVRCVTDGCAARGVTRSVRDVPAGPGLVTRPVLFCAECGAAVLEGEPAAAVGSPAAPERAVDGPPQTRARSARKRG